MVRVFGIFLLGLGITLLIPSGFALAHSTSFGQVIGWLICTGIIQVPMIVGGIAIIRRVEDAPASGIVGRGNEPVADRPSSVIPEAGDPVGRALAQVRGFELNRLNWVGWLLLLATFGFVIAESFILVL